MESGIAYRRQWPGMVPWIEEMGAAKECGYTWHEWQSLPRGERVMGVAWVRVMHLIEANQHDAQIKDMERRSRQRRHG